MCNKGKDTKDLKKKGIIAKVMDKLDKKLADKANGGGCCCGPKTNKGSSCC
jgi:hypothetical protein